MYFIGYIFDSNCFFFLFDYSNFCSIDSFKEFVLDCLFIVKQFGYDLIIWFCCFFKNDGTILYYIVFNFFLIFIILFPFFFLFMLEVYFERNFNVCSYFDVKFFRFVILGLVLFFGLFLNFCVMFFFREVHFVFFCGLFFQTFMFFLVSTVFFSKVFDVSLLKYLFLINILYIFLILSKNILFIYLVVEIFSVLLFFFLIKVKRFYTAYILKGFYIVNFISGVFFLFGMFLVYRFFGTLDLLEISNILVEIVGITNDFLFVIPFIILILSVLIKFLVFPFYYWAIDIYDNFNYFVFILNLTIVKNFYVFLLYKYFYFFFSILVIDWVRFFIFWVSILSILLGYFEALFSKTVKQVLFFSSIANSGFGFLILSLNLGNVFFNLNLFLLFFILVFFFSLLLYLLIYLFGFSEILSIFELRKIFLYNPYKGLLLGFIFFVYIGFPPFFIFFLKFLIFLTLLNLSLIFLFFIMFIVCWSYLFFLRFFVTIFDSISDINKTKKIGFFDKSFEGQSIKGYTGFLISIYIFFSLLILENFDFLFVKFLSIGV